MLGLEKFVVFFLSVRYEERCFVGETNMMSVQDQREVDGKVVTWYSRYYLCSYSGGDGGRVAGGLSRLIYSFSLLDPTFLPLCFSLESTYHMAREISLGLAFGTESVQSSVI